MVVVVVVVVGGNPSECVYEEGEGGGRHIWVPPSSGSGPGSRAAGLAVGVTGHPGPSAIFQAGPGGSRRRRHPPAREGGGVRGECRLRVPAAPHPVALVSRRPKIRTAAPRHAKGPEGEVSGPALREGKGKGRGSAWGRGGLRLGSAHPHPGSPLPALQGCEGKGHHERRRWPGPLSPLQEKEGKCGRCEYKGHRWGRSPPFHGTWVPDLGLTTCVLMGVGVDGGGGQGFPWQKW
jgi:hypothetical protein